MYGRFMILPMAEHALVTELFAGGMLVLMEPRSFQSSSSCLAAMMDAINYYHTREFLEFLSLIVCRMQNSQGTNLSCLWRHVSKHKTDYISWEEREQRCSAWALDIVA